MTMQNRPTTAPATTGGGSIVDRLMGVVTLKAPVYREIADDTTATSQAGIIVVVVAIIVSIVNGLLGNAAANSIPGLPSGAATQAAAGISIGGILGGIISALIGWLIGGWLNAFVARTLFQGRTNTGEMLRVFGYANIFEILGVVPVIGWILGPILHIVGNVIGIREAAEFDTGKAILTAVISFIIVFIITVLIVGAILALIFGAIGLSGAARPTP